MSLQPFPGKTIVSLLACMSVLSSCSQPRHIIQNDYQEILPLAIHQAKYMLEGQNKVDPFALTVSIDGRMSAVYTDMSAAAGKLSMSEISKRMMTAVENQYDKNSIRSYVVGTALSGKLPDSRGEVTFIRLLLRHGKQGPVDVVIPYAVEKKRVQYQSERYFTPGDPRSPDSPLTSPRPSLAE